MTLAQLQALSMSLQRRIHHSNGRRLKKMPSILQLLDFSQTFEIEVDTSGHGIGGVLLQDRKLIVYFSKKLSGA